MSHRIDVPLTLDKDRLLRLTPHDIDDVLERLERMRPQAPALNTFDLLAQLGGLKFVAYNHTLWAGLRHDDRTISSPDKARVLLEEYLSNGGSLAPVAHAIKRAMLLSGAISHDMWLALATDDEKAKYGEADPRAAMGAER